MQLSIQPTADKTRTKPLAKISRLAAAYN